MEQYLPYIWIGGAIVFAVLEATTAQLVSIWFVVGAVAAAITTIFTDNVFIQIAVFVAVSALALVLTRPISKKLTSAKKVKTNADSLIGKVGIVRTEINNTLSQGQITVNGQIWSAKTADDSVTVEVNKKVKVLEISGVKLVVVPVETGED